MRAFTYFLAGLTLSSLSSCAIVVRATDIPGLTTVNPECQTFSRPQFEPAPETPVSEMARINPSDHDAKVKLLLKHIRELNRHIVDERDNVTTQSITRFYQCEQSKK